ncbi:hypothetical protein C8Q79DRAFT_538870 [Trametes meyenii]|nr:hypothetical protein C8Q79DRAFT_538870 [Trametes meyenii]
MSYGQQNRTTESWNSDPNNFANAGGPNAGFHSERDHRKGPSGTEQVDSQCPTGDPTDTSNWDRDASKGANPQSGEGPFWTAAPGDNYGTESGTRGNTTDINTFGAGGDFGNTGRGVGVNADNWESRDPAVGMGQNWNHVQPGAGKASMGERLMGNAEKHAGRVTGNSSMIERGQVRKVSIVRLLQQRRMLTDVHDCHIER